jgi:hypothetical protein
MRTRGSLLSRFLSLLASEQMQRRQCWPALLARSGDGTQSSWDRLKNEPKQATTQHTRDFLEHLEWLRQQAIPAEVFADVPDIKIKQFCGPSIWVRFTTVQIQNDWRLPQRWLSPKLPARLTMSRYVCRLVQKLHNHAYDALLQHHADHVERTDSLVATSTASRWPTGVKDRGRSGCTRSALSWSMMQTAFWLNAKRMRPRPAVTICRSWHGFTPISARSSFDSWSVSN